MIKINQLSYSIGQQPILNNINLTINNGGLTALIGPNGAGKSTLLSLIARLEKANSGEIWLDEYPIATTDSRTIAKHLAILTQSNNINTRISVRDLLMFGRYPHHQGKIQKNDENIVDQALERFDLQSFSHRYLSELSGGQRQRALIAMTFCQQTSHILLDEPLNNLDMFHAKQLMQLLRKMTDELGLTTVMVVHDINMAAAYADHIIAMKNGDIVMQGTAQQLITPEHIKQIFNLDAEVITYKNKPMVVHHL